MSTKKAEKKTERAPKLITHPVAGVFTNKPRGDTSKRALTMGALFQKVGKVKGIKLKDLAPLLSRTGTVVTQPIARAWVKDFCDTTGAGAESKLDSDGELRVWGIMPKKAA